MIAQHILVPVDFSEHADQALNYALELAAKRVFKKLAVAYQAE